MRSVTILKPRIHVNERGSAVSRLEKLRSIDPKDILVFDTETTGFNVGGSRRDEILSLAVINLDGDILFNDLVKPVERKKWPKAEGVNGISPAMVKDKKTILERREEIEPLFKAAKLYVAYNAEFDLDFLRAAGLNIPKHQTFDVMKEFAKIHGEWNERYEEWAWCRLEDCAAFYDYLDFGAHDALADAKATSHCFNSILNDFLFGEPRRRPKLIDDELGAYLDYGDEDIRSIVESGYASSVVAKNESACESSEKKDPQTKTEKKREEISGSATDKTPSSPTRKANPALVAIGIACAAIGVFITAFGAAIVGVPIAILGVILAIGAKEKK